MDIEGVRKAKAELEAEILSRLVHFEVVSEMSVKQMWLEFIDVTRVGDQAKRIIAQVNVDVGL